MLDYFRKLLAAPEPAARPAPSGARPSRKKVDFNIGRFEQALAQDHHPADRRAGFEAALALWRAWDDVLKAKGE